MLDEALPILRDAGSPYRIAMALNYSGDLARCEKRYRPAQRAYEESLRLLRDLDAPRDLASVLHNLGYCYLHTANPERAGALFSESLAIQVAQGNIRGVAECLSSYAAWSSVRGLHGAAARLLAAAAAVGGQDMASAWAATRMEHDHWLAVVRSKLTPEDFDAEQRVGYELNLDEAVAYARGLPLSPAPAPSATRTGGLTPRELEVAALIAAGRTNGEIGRDLSVSKRTVETHMAHILAKLGLTHRSQVVRWALETGLVRSGQ
jgi:DNA-binding CsgD family transcriptional regulator